MNNTQIIREWTEGDRQWRIVAESKANGNIAVMLYGFSPSRPGNPWKLSSLTGRLDWGEYDSWERPALMTVRSWLRALVPESIQLQRIVHRLATIARRWAMRQARAKELIDHAQ